MVLILCLLLRIRAIWQEASISSLQPVPTAMPACHDKRLFLGHACIRSRPATVAACTDSEHDADWESSTDFCLFYTADAGIVEITQRRWKQAQAEESSVWNGNTGGEDRNEQHAGWFNGYRALLPYAHRLGRVLEVGSGPFTQTKTILQRLPVDLIKVSSITLADPLMIFYHKQVPSCPYKDGSLLGYPTQFIAAGGEDLFLRSQYDTVIMMNVLEHCRDALSVLENLHHAVKPNGILVFSERWYDTKWAQYEQSRQPFWDVMHPINVKRAVIEALLSEYEPVYRRDFFYEGSYPTDEGVYFIGIKKEQT
jgi:SAM-dependent methyltransferase